MYKPKSKSVFAMSKDNASSRQIRRRLSSSSDHDRIFYFDNARFRHRDGFVAAVRNAFFTTHRAEMMPERKKMKENRTKSAADAVENKKSEKRRPHSTQIAGHLHGLDYCVAFVSRHYAGLATDNYFSLNYTLVRFAFLF